MRSTTITTARDQTGALRKADAEEWSEDTGWTLTGENIVENYIAEVKLTKSS